MSELLAHPAWDWTQVIAAGVGFVAATLFVGKYWHDAGSAALRNPFGRFLMTRKALLAALFVIVLVNRYNAGSVVREDLWPGQDVATALVFSAFALQTFVPYRLLTEAQRAHEKEVGNGRR